MTLNNPLKVSINRNFVYMVLSIILVIASITFYAISNQQHENAQRDVIISKLDALQSVANEPRNLTLYKPSNLTLVLPDTDINSSGKISSLGGVEILSP